MVANLPEARGNLEIQPWKAAVTVDRGWGLSEWIGEVDALSFLYADSQFHRTHYRLE